MSPEEYLVLRRRRPDPGKPLRTCAACGRGPLVGARKYCPPCGQDRVGVKGKPESHQTRSEHPQPSLPRAPVENPRPAARTATSDA
jgi:hypothetical protein